MASASFGSPSNFCFDFQDTLFLASVLLSKNTRALNRVCFLLIRPRNYCTEVEESAW